MGLLVDQAGDELLGDAEEEGIGQDLWLAVELRQARDKAAADKQQPDQCGEGTRRKLEQGERNGDVIRR